MESGHICTTCVKSPRLEGLPGNPKKPPPLAPHPQLHHSRGSGAALEAPWWFPLLVLFRGTAGFRGKCGHLAQDSAKAIGAGGANFIVRHALKKLVLKNKKAQTSKKGNGENAKTWL